MAARSVGVLCRRLCSAAVTPAPAVEVVKKPNFWQRLKSGKIVTWTKSLLHDYGEACKDIVVGAKDHPGKAALYLSLIAGVGVCSSKAPSEDSFQCSLLEASASLLLLSAWTRCRNSDQHVQNLINLGNQGRLRYVNLIICSVVYEAPYDPACDIYPANCSHLQPRWLDFPSRILDVGFFSRWWLLESKMKDFDVNEDEFSHLPAHMRSTSWNDLHSEENEKLFYFKFEPIEMPEEEETPKENSSKD